MHLVTAYATKRTPDTLDVARERFGADVVVGGVPNVDPRGSQATWPFPAEQFEVVGLVAAHRTGPTFSVLRRRAAAPIEIGRFATLPQLVATLSTHGPAALLGARGIERHADALLYGPKTIAQHERAAYGDAAAWTAWDSLRDQYGDKLRGMADAHAAKIAAENERRLVSVNAAGSTGGDWFDEEAPRAALTPAEAARKYGTKPGRR